MTSVSARKLQHLNGETQNMLHNHMCSSISNASGTEAMGLVVHRNAHSTRVVLETNTAMATRSGTTLDSDVCC